MKVRGGKNKKKGPSELVSMARVFRYGIKNIGEDVCICLNGHRYEPDLVYRDGSICVDIETDEPYSGSGHPTHYLKKDGSNVDEERNQRFLDAGWYVVRFSEQQMFCHTKACMKELFKLLLEAGAVSEIPSNLAKEPDLEPVPRWTDADSREMKRKRFRPSYLGFDPVRTTFSGTLRWIWLLLPIAWQSFWDSRVRKEMFMQLGNYIKFLFSSH
jgi:hypothetical protein